MSTTTLFFLIPIGMLAAVWSLCFVGCVLQTGGIASPYSNQVLADTNLVAYWPLSDIPGATVPPGAPALPAPPMNSQSIGAASDLTGNNHNGSYTIPPAYAAGSTIAALVNPTPVSGLVLRQPSIVIGEVTKSGEVDKNLLAACVDFEGGYVSIPWAAGSPSLVSFTLEAWVQPKWTVTNFNWVVFASQTAANTGFALLINTANRWQLAVGDGSQLALIDTGVPAAVGGILTYVALTFDKTAGFKLWLNPVAQESDIPNQPATPPTPNWPPPGTASPTYVAINPAVATTFFIGAGATQLTPRTTGGDPNGSPLGPFQGLIQDVALYDAAIDPLELASHFSNGSSAT